MDHITSVSDIPLPGEDVNNGNKVQSEIKVDLQQTTELTKPIENINYEQNVSECPASKIEFDENVISLDQQVQTENTITENNQTTDESITNSEQNNQVTSEENVTDNNMDGADTEFLQETIMEVDQSLEHTIEDNDNIENKNTDQSNNSTQELEEVVENFQKFVDQINQDAVTSVIESDTIMPETTEISETKLALPSAEPDINALTDESMELTTEILELTNEKEEIPTNKTLESDTKNSETTIESSEKVESVNENTDINNSADESINLDDIDDVPLHDNSIEIKDEDISATDISSNSVETEVITETIDNTSTQASSQNTNETEISENIQEEQIIVENIEEEVTISPEISDSTNENIPTKRNARTNSTIEAIKNDWAETDTLTIEEVKPDSEPNSSPALQPVVVEPDESSRMQSEEESVTEVFVIETVNDDVQLNLDQNVTIEIIDEIKSKDNIISDGNVVVFDSIDQLKVQNQTQNSGNETVLIIQESSTTEVKQTKETPKEKPEKEKPKSNIKDRKIRNRVHSAVPCHLMGRNVDNPTEDLISNGRTPPKPRLGVKVPYRFLTSQIVSKQDIANELLQIHAKRNPEPDLPAGGDIFFAKKLTERLASKISQSEKLKKEKSDSSSGIPEQALLTPPNSQSSESGTNKTTVGNASTSNTKTSINDNSDLLAILEGDVDVDLTKEITNTKLKSSESTDTDNQIEKAMQGISSHSNLNRKLKMDPQMEREIALKQLQSMPEEMRKSGKYRRRGRPCKYTYITVPVETPKSRQTSTPNTRTTTAASKSSTVTSATVKSVPATKTAIDTKSVSNTISDIKSEKPSSSVQAKSAEEETTKKIAEKLVENLDKLKNKKVKDVVVKTDKNTKSTNKDDVVEELTDASLTPKKVSKTYSRKETVVNVVVPADLEQIVNDQSALESDAVVDKDQSSDDQKLADSDEKRVQKQINSPQKKIKRISGDINNPEITLVSKRARIIKPKVIWDPAESVPTRKIKVQVSSPVNPEARKRGRPKKSIDNTEKPEAKIEKSEEKSETSEETSKELEVTEKSPEEKNDSEDKDEAMEVEEINSEKESDDTAKKETEKRGIIKSKIIKTKKGKILSRAALKKVQKAKKLLYKRQVQSLRGKLIRSSNGEYKSSLALTKKKKHIVAEIANKVKKGSKPKSSSKKTELDKLLSDEGAVNMLYSVRQDEKVGRGKLIPSKDLLNRTKALRKVITQNSIKEDSPKALRKKDSPTLTPLQITQKERKKSRDSIRSSIQSPPPSPSYLSNRAEASRIIRRHSSSFSSECSSPRRLSIDVQNLQENSEKQENKSEQKDIEDKDSADLTSVRNLRRKGVPIYERKSDEKTYKGKKKLLPEIETWKETDDNKEENKDSNDRLVPTVEKIEREKLTLSEKRKLNTEMSKNFSKSPLPKKRTRNSKNEDDEEQIKEQEKTAKTSKLQSKLNKKLEEDAEDKPQRTRHISVNTDYKEISLRKIDNLVQIILTPTNTKLHNCMNMQMFKELHEVLTDLGEDDSCRVVLMTSTDSDFCHGVDFSSLIQSNTEKRIAVAQEMAGSLMDFLRTLTNFPKPIIAGVQGSAVGLGVTMLPLFDLVFASDKATFSTPYGRLGQVPEGIAFITLPNLLGNTLTSELMFANRKLTASEAVHHRLVTKTIWPDKFQEEVVSSALKISTQSGQSMMATKKLLRQSLLSKLDEALESENKLLISHWTSAECQHNFKKLLQEDEWW